MNRKNFLSSLALSSLLVLKAKSMANTVIQPETFYFKDDGKIPNNKLPLLIYRNALPGLDASKLQKQFAANNWTNERDNSFFPGVN